MEVTAGMIMTAAGAAGTVLCIVLLALMRRWFAGQRRRLLEELERE